MKVKLTRIRSNHERLRTDEVVGDARYLPMVGERFVMTSESVDPACDLRRIDTTPAKQVWGCGYRKMRFMTENSLYQLEILGEDDWEGPEAA